MDMSFRSESALMTKYLVHVTLHSCRIIIVSDVQNWLTCNSLERSEGDLLYLRPCWVSLN